MWLYCTGLQECLEIVKMASPEQVSGNVDGIAELVPYRVYVKNAVVLHRATEENREGVFWQFGNQFVYAEVHWLIQDESDRAIFTVFGEQDHAPVKTLVGQHRLCNQIASLLSFPYGSIVIHLVRI